MINEMIERFYDIKGSEEGFTTAELLGNAAIGILVAVALWAVLQGRAETLINTLFDKITGTV